nr:ARID DNA-binding domain-containing protein [Tanacetum cinerariifolium]
MLKNKMKEVIQHNTTLNQPTSNERFKNYKCFQCKQLGHIIKTCPMDYKAENTDAKKETKKRMEGIVATKPTVLITYPETVHFSTTCMIKGIDLTGWDEIWYVSNKTDRHVCYKLDAFCNIKEEFSVTKLENQRKFLFTYGLGEILIEANGKSHIIPGVYYAPEMTLNILSLELLEKQGFQVTYDGNRCSLSLMFKDKEIKRFDEDRLRRMHNHYMQEYFESISKEGEGLEQDTVRIKGNLYTTKIQSFNDFVACLNLVKIDDVWYRSHEALDLGLQGVVGVEFMKKRRYEKREYFMLPIQLSTARVDVSTAIGNLMLSRVLSVVGLKPRFAIQLFSPCVSSSKAGINNNKSYNEEHMKEKPRIRSSRFGLSSRPRRQKRRRKSRPSSSPSSSKKRTLASSS